MNLTDKWWAIYSIIIIIGSILLLIFGIIPYGVFWISLIIITSVTILKSVIQMEMWNLRHGR